MRWSISAWCHWRHWTSYVRCVKCQEVCWLNTCSILNFLQNHHISLASGRLTSFLVLRQRAGSLDKDPRMLPLIFTLNFHLISGIRYPVFWGYLHRSPSIFPAKGVLPYSCHVFAYTRVYMHIHVPIFFYNSSFLVRKCFGSKKIHHFARKMKSWSILLHFHKGGPLRTSQTPSKSHFFRPWVGVVLGIQKL